MKGKVKFFNNAKGWGFISLEDGTDIFAHYKSILGEGFKTLIDGEEVECEVGDSPRGKFAVSIKKLNIIPVKNLKTKVYFNEEEEKSNFDLKIEVE